MLRFKEQALLDAIPDRAWNRLLENAPMSEVVTILRYEMPFGLGLKEAVNLYKDMKLALGIR